VTIGDIAEVNLLYDNTLRSDRQENVFGFKAISAGATLANLGTAFQAALVSNAVGRLLNLTSSTITTSELEVRSVVPGTAAPVIQPYAAVVGAQPGDVLPPQNAYLISWRTPLAGRSFRGRSFLPGVVESAQNGGTLTAGVVTGLQSIVTQMLAVFGPTGTDPNWQFVIISRVNGGIRRVPPIGTGVTSGLVSTEVQTQRRRNN
jgi:hypothetical protein